MSTPLAAYQRVFASFTAPAADPTAAAHTRALRKSILDDVLADLTALRGRSGSDERAALDLHAGMIRDIEKQIDVLPAASCQVPASPVVPPHIGYDFPSFAAALKSQMDQAVAALACDLTRFAALSITWGGYPITFSNFGMSAADCQRQPESVVI
jgi:hypothetical protein